MSEKLEELISLLYQDKLTQCGKRLLVENIEKLQKENKELKKTITEELKKELEALADSNNHINTDISDENNIKYVELVFENCEVARLYPNMFKYLVIENIVRNKDINCFQHKKGECWDDLSCSYFSITILPEGYEQKMQWVNQSLKERLESCNDITSVYLTYNNGKEECIYVPWKEDNDYINKYQKTQFESDSITIKIEKE